MNKLQSLYENILLPLNDVLFKINNQGIRLDIDYLQEMTKWYESVLVDLRVKMFKEVGKEFNPRFLWAILNQYRREGIYLKLMRESINGLFNRDEIKILEVPLPPLNVQNEIVGDIEENLSTLKDTKKVLNKFENKFTNLLEEIFAV